MESTCTCLAYSSTLKIETVCSSESSVNIHCTIRRHVPEDSTSDSHHCETPKSHSVRSFRFSLFVISLFCLRLSSAVMIWTVELARKKITQLKYTTTLSLLASL
jgi:hypothetical protein